MTFEEPNRKLLPAKLAGAFYLVLQKSCALFVASI
jgi:hypothetical protein